MLYYGGFFTQHNGTRGERRKKREFAVQPDIICFVEGDSWGHSGKRGEEGETGVCFPKRLSSVCGRGDPACGQTDTRGEKGERTSGDMEESKG